MINFIHTDLPDDVISETFPVIYNHKFRKVVMLTKTKSGKQKTDERWFCLKEKDGKDLPVYVREGATRTGFKSFNAFFAMAGYYRSTKY